MVITMAKLLRVHTSTHSTRKPPGPIQPDLQFFQIAPLPRAQEFLTLKPEIKNLILRYLIVVKVLTQYLVVTMLCFVQIVIKYSLNLVQYKNIIKMRTNYVKRQWNIGQGGLCVPHVVPFANEAGRC